MAESHGGAQQVVLGDDQGDVDGAGEILAGEREDPVFQAPAGGGLDGEASLAQAHHHAEGDAGRHLYGRGEDVVGHLTIVGGECSQEAALPEFERHVAGAGADRRCGCEVDAAAPYRGDAPGMGEQRPLLVGNGRHGCLLWLSG